MHPTWNVEQIEMKFMGKNRSTKEKYLAEAGWRTYIFAKNILYFPEEFL